MKMRMTFAAMAATILALASGLEMNAGTPKVRTGI